MVKLLIMDIDGTLVRTRINWSEVKNLLKNIVGVELDDRPIALQIDSGKISQDVIKDVEKAILFVEAKSVKDVMPDQELVELLKSLRKNGVRIGIVTLRSRKTSIPLLKKLGVLDLVEMVVTREDSPYRKKQLEIMLNALKASPNDTIFIGDMDHDEIAGKSLGIATVMIDSEEGSYGVPDQLKSFLRQLCTQK